MGETLKIKNVLPKLELSINTCVVGSSKKILENKNGILIDTFDDVVRFNRAPSENFEVFVGSKTTLRVANIHVVQNIPIGVAGWDGQPQFFIKNLKNARILYYGMSPELLDIKNNLDESSTFYYIEDGIITYIYKEKQISCGLTFVLMAISSGICPVLFGFDLNIGEERGHYWESIPKTVVAYHDENFEKEILNDLVKSGKVIVK